MSRVWDVVRSVFLWLMSWLHFLIVVPILIALAVVLDPRKHDWLQRGLCRRIGNVPVPDVRSAKDLKRLWRMTQAAVDSGVSLIIFPEAKRTRDGHLNEFEDGGFRLAQQLGVPIVPVSLVGSFRHLRTEDWILRPTTITVYLHDTIETKGMKKEEVPVLKERVRRIIEEPVEASLEQRVGSGEKATAETA